MAAKSGGKNKQAWPGDDVLRKQLRSGDLGNLYVLFGSEDYLRESYLTLLRQKVLEGSEFDHHRFQGEDLELSQVIAAVQTPPFLSPRTMVELWDFDPFKAREAAREDLIALLDSLPEDCCLVFVFDQQTYNPDRRLKKLAAAMDKARVFEFTQPSETQLAGWIARHFKEAGKTIDREQCRYLSFLTGASMTRLNQEIEKVAAYAQDQQITRADIDAVVTPVLEAGAFDMVDQVSKGAFDQALIKLRELYQLEVKPIPILGALGYQLRRLYGARLLLDAGQGDGAVKDRYHLGDYAARMLVQAARRFSAPWCAKALVLLAQTDYRLKTSYGDEEQQLELLLLLLAQEAKA